MPLSRGASELGNCPATSTCANIGTMLVPCIECGRQVSSEAGICQHCRKSAHGFTCTICGVTAPESTSVWRKAPKYHYKIFICSACYAAVTKRLTITCHECGVSIDDYCCYCPNCGAHLPWGVCTLCGEDCGKILALLVSRTNRFRSPKKACGAANGITRFVATPRSRANQELQILATRTRHERLVSSALFALPIVVLGRAVILARIVIT